MTFDLDQARASEQKALHEEVLAARAAKAAYYDQNQSLYANADLGRGQFAGAASLARNPAPSPDAPLLSDLMGRCDVLANMLAQAREVAAQTRQRTVGAWPTGIGSSGDANKVSEPNQASALRNRMDTLIAIARELCEHVAAVDQGL